MYACRFTDETGTLQIALPTEGSDAHTVDMWTRVRRTWQEDRGIPKDAVVVRHDGDDASWEPVTRLGRCDQCLLTVELDEDAKPVEHSVGYAACGGSSRYAREMLPLQ
ncbi:hypothetical protein AB0395_22190 [Streptosporangium sp. NPDC051023]|uniref:hypothetical protein n=1 Tax=Streptosporangium sp. NPDC051023 TaxID=3155410 RepID=UPI00344C3AC4